jgi:hypothetical protein
MGSAPVTGTGQAWIEGPPHIPGFPRSFVGAARSPSSESPSSEEVRSWSPVSGARAWQGQRGEHWTSPTFPVTQAKP